MSLLAISCVESLPTDWIMWRDRDDERREMYRSRSSPKNSEPRERSIEILKAGILPTINLGGLTNASVP
jgi:hypothetical protein